MFFVSPQAKYQPSYLLCSETFRWFPLDACVVKLEKSKYARFCDDLKLDDEDGRVDDGQIVLFRHSFPITLRQYLSKAEIAQSKLESIREYAKLVGKRCTLQLQYYLS